MATLSSPVILRVHGWASAGRETMRMPRSTAPSTTVTQLPYPAVARMMVSIVAMNRTWWPVRKT